MLRAQQSCRHVVRTILNKLADAAIQKVGNIDRNVDCKDEGEVDIAKNRYPAKKYVQNEDASAGGKRDVVSKCHKGTKAQSPFL